MCTCPEEGGRARARPRACQCARKLNIWGGSRVRIHTFARAPERYIVPPICSSWGNPLLGEARTFATNCERCVHAGNTAAAAATVKLLEHERRASTNRSAMRRRKNNVLIGHCDINDSFADKWLAIRRLKTLYDLYSWLDKRTLTFTCSVLHRFVRSRDLSLFDKRLTLRRILAVAF